MVLPPLYKYLDVQGAKLTLGNGTFKHAKPSDFNDTEDLTVQSIFPEDLEAACKRASVGVIDVIAANLDRPPTCASPMKEKLSLIQAALRADPTAVPRMKEEIAKGAMDGIYDMDKLRATAEATIEDINAFLQGWRVLCVTTHRDLEKMWSGYAEGHKGIALRIVPNVAKDSKFQKFVPVAYRAQRPPLHDDVLNFVEGTLFENQEARYLTIMRKIIYAKTLDWQHEGEYRLAIPIAQGEEPWNTLPYHPEEITEVLLGAAMADADKSAIVALAKDQNPDIMVFQAKNNGGAQISFESV